MSSTINDVAKTIPLPTFDGEPKKIKMWWARFEAYGAVKKFSRAIIRWSRREMSNAVSDLSRYNGSGSEEHVDAMQRAMRYALGTPTRGLAMTPNTTWDGDPNFIIHGTAGASYKPYEDSGSSVGGNAVFLHDAPNSERTKIQQCTTLSITEAELVSGFDCAQDMLFAMRVLESIGLK